MPMNWPQGQEGSELTYPNIYPIDELMECMKGLVLQIQNYRISMIQRIS